MQNPVKFLIKNVTDYKKNIACESPGAEEPGGFVSDVQVQPRWTKKRVHTAHSQCEIYKRTVRFQPLISATLRQPREGNIKATPQGFL